MKESVKRILALLLLVIMLPTEAVLADHSQYAGEILINEFMANANYGAVDMDGDIGDWIELYNTGNTDISLQEFCLSDDENDLEKWHFPGNAIIPAGGYYFLFCTGKDKLESETNFPHTSFCIPSEGGEIILSCAGREVDRVVCPDMDGDHSYGRDPANMNQWLRIPYITPGMPNVSYNAEAIASCSKGTSVIADTGIVISEVLASAQTVKADGKNAEDFVEIHNTTDSPVDLSGWGLSDNKKKPLKWQFPEGTVLNAGEYLVVIMDKGENTKGAPLHASFSISRTNRETVVLALPDGTITDRVTLPVMYTDVSYGRETQGSALCFFDTPTPGRENNIGFAGYTGTPAFSVASGLYDGVLTVDVTVPENARVYYTLDGSVPTENNGTLYTGSLQITKNMVLRARAFENGLRPSETISASYLMNTNHTLRVVSLIIDPDELWNDATGMLADGKGAEKVAGVLPFKNTVYRKYGKQEREAYVEVFEQQNKTSAVISQGATLSLQGAYSMDMPQKSMKVKAKSALGQKYFEYPLFEDRPYTEYKSFVLRNSGNDCVWTRLVDCFQTELIDRFINTDIITLAYEPCAVYLNGEYWGHFNMRERKDKYCIAQHEGLSEDEVDGITIIKGNYTAVQGSNAEYKEMVNKIRNSSPNKKKADREYLDSHVDVESFLDWFAIKMFFGDSDPGNVLYYKLPGEGAKWKCLIFDMDYGMFKSTFDSPASYMKSNGMGQQKIVNIVFKKILEVTEYKELFYQKMGAIYQALTEETMNAVLDEMIAVLEPELSLHFERWAGDPGWKLVNSDTPLTASGMYTYWQKRISRLRNVIHKRPYYIYTLFQKQYKLNKKQMEQYFGGPCPAKPKDIN